MEEERRNSIMVAESDNLCLKCLIRGRCCYYHIFINGFQIEIDEHCEYLKENGLCSIYKERHRNPYCLSIEQMKMQGTLLSNCLYIKDDKEYLKRKDRRIARERIEILVE